MSEDSWVYAWKLQLGVRPDFQYPPRFVEDLKPPSRSWQGHRQVQRESLRSSI